MTALVDDRRDPLTDKALLAVRLHGLDEGKRGPAAPRETTLGTIGEGASDLLVAIDDGTPDLDRALAAAHAAVRERGVFVLFVASETAVALRGESRARPHEDGAEGPWAEALAWARRRTETAVPAVSGERLRAIVASADRAGLVLVERELGGVLAGSPTMRSAFPTAEDRAFVAVFARGALARPLLFVPRGRAPKNGLAKSKPERLLEGFFRVGAIAENDATDPASLEAAALGVLRARASLSPPVIAGKELLREARDAWVTLAKKHGKKASPSTNDTAKLGALLVRLYESGELEAFASDSAFASEPHSEP